MNKQVKVRRGYAFRRGDKTYKEGTLVDVTDKEFSANSWKFEGIVVGKEKSVEVEAKNIPEEIVNNRAMGISNASVIVNRGRKK